MKKNPFTPDTFHTHTLSSGMRVICAPCPTASVYCGIAVQAGTRDELPGESGLAHLTEHMCFKGTPHLTSRQIMRRMESVGGDLNAFTSKEETIYCTTCQQEHLPRAISLLIDITLHSTFPERELEKEREVVCDEIESYNDQPVELIFDEFESMAYEEHPMGRSILGDAAMVRRTTQAQLADFTRRLYRPGHMVLYVYGQVDPRRVFSLAEHTLARTGHTALPETAQPRLAPSLPRYARMEHEVEKHTHQAHVVVGARSFAGNDPRSIHLFLLSHMLGGPCMTSRLNLTLRERHGLVYTVESHSTAYGDSGLWTTYFGCDPHDVSRCLRLTRQELDRLAQSPLAPRTLRQAVVQLEGQITLSYDNFESVSIGMAKRYLRFGTTQSRQELFGRLEAITPQELMETAQTVFSPERLLTLIYR